MAMTKRSIIILFFGIFLYPQLSFASTLSISAWAPYGSPWVPYGLEGKGIEKILSHIGIFQSISPFAYTVTKDDIRPIAK